MSGVLIRPLPSRPWPVDRAGPEAFGGYVERSGALQLLPLSVTTLLTRAGVIEVDLQSALPHGYGVDLTDAQVASFARTHDLPEDAIRGMLLRRYDGVAFDLSGLDVTDAGSVRRVASREWANFVGSAYCPACMAAGPVWNLEWKLWFSVVCPLHRTLLVDRCPRCARRPGNVRAEAGGVPLYATRPVQPGICLNPPAPGMAGEGRSAAPCGHVLAETPSLDLSGAPRLLLAQDRVLSVLRAQEAIVSGVPMPALIYVQHLKSLTALLMHVAQPEDLGTLPPELTRTLDDHVRERDLTRARQQGRRGTSIHPYKAPPGDLRLTAAVLPLATELLAQPDDAGIERMLAPVVRRAQEVKGQHVRQLADYFHLQGPLLAAFDRMLETGATFERRLGRRSLPEMRTDFTFTSSEVPQLLWADEYDLHFARFFSGSTLDPSYARRVCSMALVRLCGPYTWAQAADALSLPVSHATGAVNSAMGLLGSGGLDGAFREALHALAGRLFRQASRVDYRERRERLAGLTLLPLEDWQRVARRAGIQGVKDTARRRGATAWVWAEVTGGDPRLSPALNTAEGNRRSRMEMYRRFETQDLASLQAGLGAIVRKLNTAGRN